MRSWTAWLCAVVVMGWGLAATADFRTGHKAFEARDYSTALTELLPLAEQGDAEAQRMLGLMFRNGLIGVPDNIGAARWFRAAAEQGDPESLYQLGLMYYQGDTQLPDGGDDKIALRAASVDMFESAANLGHVEAQLYLGHAYAEGDGVGRDSLTAFKWYQLAAWQRNTLAVAARDRLASQMTVEQVAQARRMARDWQPDTPEQ